MLDEIDLCTDLATDAEEIMAASPPGSLRPFFRFLLSSMDAGIAVEDAENRPLCGRSEREEFPYLCSFLHVVVCFPSLVPPLSVSTVDKQAGDIVLSKAIVTR